VQQDVHIEAKAERDQQKIELVEDKRLVANATSDPVVGEPIQEPDALFDNPKIKSFLDTPEVAGSPTE